MASRTPDQHGAEKFSSNRVPGRCSVLLRIRFSDAIRATRSWAGLITGLFCFTYSLDQFFYSLTFAGILVRRFAAHFVPRFVPLENLEALFQSRLLFLDLVNTCGICLGIVLLLVEQYQRTERDLEESHRRSYGLVAMNSRLQSEIQERLRTNKLCAKVKAATATWSKAAKI